MLKLLENERLKNANIYDQNTDRFKWPSHTGFENFLSESGNGSPSSCAREKNRR